MREHCRFFDQNLRGIFLYENGYIFQIKCTPNKCCHINPGQNHFFSRNIYPFLKKEQNCDFSTPVCSKFRGIFLHENGHIFQIKCTPNKYCHINPGGNHFFSGNIYPFLKKEQNCDFRKSKNP